MRPGPPATACPWAAARLLEKKRGGNKKEKHTMLYPPEPLPTHTDTHRHTQTRAYLHTTGGWTWLERKKTERMGERE